MIKASELRLGNLVRHKSENTPWRVNLNLLESIDDGAMVFYGIPLTSEILESCGFGYRENNHNKWYWIKVEQAQFKLYVHDGKFYFAPYEMNYQKEIPYLHQLQNLYFALTGKELLVKDPVTER